MEDIPDNEFDRKKIEDFVSFVVEGLLFYSYSFARRCSILTRKFLEKNQFIDIVETVSDKLEDYPLLKILVLGAAILCIFPVGLFFMFAIVSLIITFALFLIIEGTILAGGALFMCGCLISIVLVLSSWVVLIGSCYVVATKLQLFSRFTKS